MNDETTTMIGSMLEKTGMQNTEFLSSVYLGNSVLDWVSSVVLFLVILLLLSKVQHYAVKYMKKLAAKTKLTIDDAIIQYLEHLSVFFYCSASLFAAVSHLQLPPIVHLLIKGAFFLSVISEAIRLAEKILEFVITLKMRPMGKEVEGLSSALKLILRVVLWIVGILMILQNLGINVTSLIASLGIGGLAVSLALQPVFMDIFSSFSIIFDKPFEVGDFIVTGDFKGTVKKVGLKTTRLQALQGEELVISNTELTTARVQNFKRLQKRRIVFSIGVTYDTPKAKLEKIPTILKECIQPEEKVDFDRAHFWEFGDSSLNYEIVYYILSSEYIDYMNTQQSINLKIVEAFEKEGIEMAFPTRTIYMAKGQ